MTFEYKPEPITIRASDGSIVKMEHFNALHSTIDVARRYAQSGVPDRYVIYADNKVLNDDGDMEEGVFISLILRPSIFPSQASLLGAMSATALLLALEEHTTKRLGLGWVSDLYCEGVRIGNTQIEGKLDNFTSYEYLIVTFSVILDDKSFPPRLTDMIKKVFESNNNSIGMIIAKNIINTFLSFYQNIKTSTKFMEIYTRKFILRNVRVKHIEDGKKRTRRILGVDTKTGALILEEKQLGENDGMIFVTSPSSVIMPKKVNIPKKTVD